jgi:predicted HicB family RNase H-like nuclease
MLTRPERVVSDLIKQRAAARGISISQYVADVLATHVGRTDLVRELDKEPMPLAM